MRQNEHRRISIIIPVLNEDAYIERLLRFLKPYTARPFILEVIVVDGGSSDQTVLKVSRHGARLISGEKGRAKQMNAGARIAQSDILYFLHADTLPPLDFDRAILEAVSGKYRAGCFRMKFDHTSLFLRFFSWFSRVNFLICRGGDQSLFITRELFEQTGGFNERYRVYEDNEFISRLYRLTGFRILPQYVRTSARRYRAKGMFRLQYHFGIIHLKKFLGISPEKLYDYYRKHIAT